MVDTAALCTPGTVLGTAKKVGCKRVLSLPATFTYYWKVAAVKHASKNEELGCSQVKHAL